MSDAQTGQPLHESELPPANLEYLIYFLVAQARLALIPFGEEKDEPKVDLGFARHRIDLLDVLQQKTKGNLTLNEQRELENALTELRFLYVQAFEDSKKRPAAPSQPPPAESQQA